MTAIDWAKRIEIIYRSISHTIEQTRKHSITSTDYVSLLNAHYRAAKKMLDLNFEIRGNIDDEYKVELDNTINKYLSDEEHWTKTQIKINEALNELNYFMNEFSEIKPSEEIETKYINELIKPVNTLLAKYQQKNSSPEDIVYKLSIDAGGSDYYLNDVLIYHTKLGTSDDVMQMAFQKKGVIKEYISDKNINTSSIRGNFNLPNTLKRAMIKSTNNKRGIRIRSVITEADIVKYDIDRSEVDEWLRRQQRQ